MAKIQADQIEVGAGPQHSLPKYGPGPGWELVASRITDDGTTINVPGREVNIGDLSAQVNNGTGARFVDEDKELYIAANGKNASTNSKLDMAADAVVQAVLSATRSGNVARLSVKAHPTSASAVIDLGFVTANHGTLNLAAETVNVNGVSLKRNGIQLGVVYSDALVNQLTDIPPVNLTVDGASGVSGLFRISYYLVITTPGTSGTVKATFGWTDPATARSVDSATLTFGTLAAPASGSLIVRSTGVANITVATTVDSPVGDPEYALYVTLERLQ